MEELFLDYENSLLLKEKGFDKECFGIFNPNKEFELLSLLMSVPHKVFRREEILNDVWGDAYIGDRTIDVHIRKLREKFGVDIIQTVKGVGYKFMG